MNVFLTGATGFIGQHLVRGLLDAGYRVRILHRPASDLSALAGLPLERVQGAVEDGTSLQGAVDGCDGVIHLAGQFSLWPQDYPQLFRANVQGTANVLAAAAAAGRPRFVYVSSAGAIGLNTSPEPLDEGAVFNGERWHLPYHRSKHLAEQRVLQAVGEGLPAVIVNPSLVIGPGDHGLENALFRPVLRSPALFWLTGGGNVVAVADVVAGTIAALERGRPGHRYILGGENLPYREQVSIIAEMAGRSKPWLPLHPALALGLSTGAALAHRVFPLPSFVSPQFARVSALWAYYSSAKAARELGYAWRPYREAVAETLAWYRRAGLLS